MAMQLRTPGLRSGLSARVPIRRLHQPGVDHLRATWRSASPRRIEASLAVARSRDAGGWFVVCPADEVRSHVTTTRFVAGHEITLWRKGDGALVAGPGACPHLGALLDGCPVVDGTARCRWHGLELDPAGGHGWAAYPSHDDGVLAWVRLPVAGEQPTELPRPSARPPLAESISAVIAPVGICEPVDVVANRLDPWHGSWFHPYAFSHLEVDEPASSDERLVVDVAFRLNRTWGVPVRAEFVCPDSRTIVMRIVDGEGLGSVVETHATPIAPGADGRHRTVVTEATIAHSARRGFRAARPMSALISAAMRRTARRLWIDDLAYAERRYALRTRA